LPYRTQPKLELSEGPHMGYAMQWFTFAALLGIGYPFFIKRQERRTREQATDI
jgi:surfeit locus 1 family protein